MPKTRMEETVARQAAELENLYLAAPVGLFYVDSDLRCIRLNKTMAEQLGLPPERVVHRSVHELLAPGLVEVVESLMRKVMETGEPVVEREVHGGPSTRAGEQRDWLVSYYPVSDQNEKILGLHGVVQDITERKRAEANRLLLTDILQILNRSGDLHSMLRDVLGLIRERAGFDAVGLRLHRGEDCPYFQQDGFSEEFLREENFLCAKKGDGAILRDPEGRAVLECTCGLVLSGRTDPCMSCFTKGGSFWTNRSTELLALPRDDDPRTNPRNNCIHRGYQSVGLFPVRAGQEIVGLLQLNDRREGLFTPETIAFYESLAQNIGLALQRIVAEEGVRQSESKLRFSEEKFAKAFAQNAAGMFITRLEDGRYVEVNDTWLAMFGYEREQVLGRTPLELNLWPMIEDRECAMEQLRTRGAFRNLEFTLRRHSGEPFVALASGEIMTMGGEKVILGSCLDITERKRAEEALESSEARFRTIYETEPECVKMLASDGRLLEINPAGLAMIEADGLEEVLGQPMDSLIAPEHRQAFCALTESVCRGNPGTLEFEIVGLKGAHRWLETHAVPFRRWPEDETCLLAITRDITKHKQAEAAVRESNEQISNILSSISDAFFSLDECLRVTYFNAAAERLLKRPREEVLGRPLFDAFPEAKGSIFETSYTQALREKKFLSFETYFDREPYRNWYDVRVYPKANGISVYFQIITERKRAEAALRESEERFRLCFDLSAAGSTEVDPITSRFLQANQKFCDSTGYSRQELQSMTFSDVTHLEDRTKHQELHRQLLRGEVQNYNLEKRYVRKDGQIIWAHLAVALVRDAAGNPLRCIGTMVDVTEQKRAEEALAAAKDQLQHYADNLEKVVEERTAQLQETVNELEHFSYTITHDMRAPLRAMQNFAFLMLEGECSDCLRSVSKGFLVRIQAAARRMDTLITDALQYSRMLRNQFPSQPVDVAPLLRSLIETYPNLQPPRVQIRIEGDFPLVLGNEAGLTQCFSNLLGNAVKFVDPGKTPQVRVWAEKRNGFVRVWVEDNGIGIEKEHQDRIWGMFETLESTGDGTGIGLALVRKVVERMGGRTGVESEPGQGSRFWVELKAAN